MLNGQDVGLERTCGPACNQTYELQGHTPQNETGTCVTSKVEFITPPDGSCNETIVTTTDCEFSGYAPAAEADDTAAFGGRCPTDAEYTSGAAVCDTQYQKREIAIVNKEANNGLSCEAVYPDTWEGTNRYTACVFRPCPVNCIASWKKVGGEYKDPPDAEFCTPYHMKQDWVYEVTQAPNWTGTACEATDGAKKTDVGREQRDQQGPICGSNL
jgi:hypothetical protein